MGESTITASSILARYPQDVEWIKIERLAEILDQFTAPKYHPQDPRYREAWNEMRTKCIEGIWFPQFGGYRHVPGRLGFYAKYCTIVDTVNKVRHDISPDIRDLEWHFAYYIMEAMGFSGFEDDDEYTCNYDIYRFNDLRLNEKLPLINKNGDLKKFITPREYLFKIHDRPLGRPLYHNPNKNFVILGSRGGGKATLYSENVYKETGKTTIGELQVGDQIYGSDGKLCNVVEIHPQGVTDVYKVEFSDGRVLNTHPEHLWKVKGRKHPLSTIEMLNNGIYYSHKKSGKTYKFQIEQCSEVDYPEKELPIHPYILGCLLGDGTMTTRTPKIASSDIEILESFEELLPDYELNYDNSTTNNHTIKYIGEERMFVKRRVKGDFWARFNPLFKKIEALGLNVNCRNKFIPEIYKYGSIEQRYELVRGLMDTDGSINKSGSIEFSNTNFQLVQDLAEVLRSLGIRCEIGKDTRKGESHSIKGHVCERSEYWRLYVNTSKEIFKLSRKKERLKKRQREGYATIINIEKLEEQQPTICITVDAPDHCYLTTDYLVTHNSFSVGGMVIKYELVFHGARYADAPIGKAEVEVGSGISSKSSEFLDKVESSIRMLSELPKFGVYGEPEDEDYEPCPFYIHMQGSLKTNNHKNPWTQYRDVKKGNNWKKVGNFDKLYHTVYSDNKKEGAESAAGGRRVAVVYEEMGLMKLIKEAWGSNNAVVATDGVQFGSQIGIGTSGNIDLIQYTKHIFTHPKDYNLLDFNGHAFFLPAPLVDKRFKDENGNTDLEKAYEFYHNEREKAKLASDPQVLISHRMNLPLQIDDMWLGGSSGYLPEKEAEEREKELIRNNLYESIGQAIELYWDSGTQSGVNYRIKPLSEAKPIYNWPLAPSDPTHGEVMIYIHPDKLKINGVIPNDAVIILHDPYVSDELDKGGSLGASYVIVNPKYESFGLPSYQIAATWISRHPNGVDGYNEVFEKLIQFYGNPIRGVWYEANRGDRFRGHMLKKKKASLLCLRPQFEQGQFIYSRNVTQTGYMVSNRIAKVTLLDGLRDLLLTDVGGKLLIETIPCLYTIKQMRQFTMDGNFDGISALQGLPLAVNELEHYSTNKQSSGIFDGLTKNLKNALNRTQQRPQVV